MSPDAELALATALGAALQARGWRCAAAESCTGGLVAGAITAIAGSSGWFERGFVTYTNEAKHEMLDVPVEMLRAYGAVSEPVAEAMAAGALAHSSADVAVAITGVAGPGGGTAAKPVGMVCFAWAVRGAVPQAATHHLPGDRAAVRQAAVAVALQGLLARASGPVAKPQ
jgi:nicotinamide-nucleotide amidase